MKKCAICGRNLPSTIIVNGKIIYYKDRIHCVFCVPPKGVKAEDLKITYVFCKYCGKQLDDARNIFCSSQCKADYDYITYIQKWKSGIVDGCKSYNLSNYIRRYLLEKNNYKCSRCGWGEINPYTGNYTLEVRHIDGNYKNNDESNLELLCPNCHALTDTYKNLNKNCKRFERHKYK